MPEVKILQEGTTARGRIEDFEGPITPVLYRDTHGELMLGVRRHDYLLVDLLVISPRVEERQAAVLACRWIAFMEEVRREGLTINEATARNAWYATDTAPSGEIADHVNRAIQIMIRLLGFLAVSRVRILTAGSNAGSRGA